MIKEKRNVRIGITLFIYEKNIKRTYIHYKKYDTKNWNIKKLVDTSIEKMKNDKHEPSFKNSKIELFKIDIIDIGDHF